MISVPTRSVPRARSPRGLVAGASVLIGALALVGLLATPANAVTSTVTTSGQLTTALADGAVDTIVLGADITLPSPLATGRTFTLDLADHALTLPNLTVTPGTSLSIDDSGTTGRLVANATSTAFGRSGITTAGASLEILGGTITAMAWGSAAGIGGDSTGRQGGILTISGGTVTATGGSNSAGIGGSSPDTSTVGGSGGTVHISGGTVTANGGIYAAGIGGGGMAPAGDIQISGGAVTATGGDNGPGIGNGRAASGANSTTAIVSITGGTVTANGGRFSGPGIGGGYGAPGVDLDIASGAVVTVSDAGGYQPLGYGYGAPSAWWGDYDIAGTLILANNFQIPPGQTVTVLAGGVLAGPGVIRQNFPGSWGGTVENDGTVTASIDAWTYLTGNDFTVVFQSNRAGAAPAVAPTIRVLAPSLAAAGVALPSFPTAAGALAWGWNAAANGTGPAFDATTTLTASLTVYADWRAFTHLTITADDDTIVAGGTATIDVVGHEPISGLTSVQTAFSTYTSDIATDAVDGNEVTMTEAGVHRISASVAGVTGHVDITVSAGPLHSIIATPSVSGSAIGTPDDATTTAGDPVTLAVEGFDSYANSIGDLSAQATIDTAGTETATDASFTPTLAGTRTVTTTVSGISTALTLTVVPAAYASAVVGLSTTWTAGVPVQVRATGYDAYGNSRGLLDTSGLAISSSDGGDIVDGAELTGFAAGTRTIRVEAPAPAPAQEFEVTVVPGPLTRIAVDGPGLIVAGYAPTFTAAGWDAYDNPIGDVGDQVQFATDSPDATTDPHDGARFTVIRAGLAHITATLLDDPTITATLDIEIVPGALASITVVPQDDTVTAGETLAFTYLGADAFGNPISLCGCDLVLSTPESSDLVSNDEITFERAGARAVSATMGASVLGPEVTGTVAIEVLPAEPIEVTLSVTETSVRQGGSLTLTVSGLDAFGNSIPAVGGAWIESDQPTDVIDGLTVHFPHASPHVITAHAGTLTSRMLIQVIPSLAATGSSPLPILLVGLAALLLGGLGLATSSELRRLVTRRRTRLPTRARTGPE